MTDTISRQAAIDRLAEDMPSAYTPDGSHPADDGIFMAQEIYADCIQTLKELPPAQPQIIRCNECKWNRTENRKETKQWLPCRAIVTPDDFSCIYAEGKANG